MVEEVHQQGTAGTAEREAEDEEDETEDPHNQGLLRDQLWFEVQDPSEKGLHYRELRVQAECEEHGEEEDGPDRSCWEPGQGVERVPD